jgi:hypothetical protein
MSLKDIDWCEQAGVPRSQCVQCRSEFQTVAASTPSESRDRPVARHDACAPGTPSSQMPPIGAAAMTTVEARGSVPSYPAAVSRDRFGEWDPAPGAALTRQGAQALIREDRQDGPSQGPADTLDSTGSRTVESPFLPVPASATGGNGLDGRPGSGPTNPVDVLREDRRERERTARLTDVERERYLEFAADARAEMDGGEW